MQKPIRFAYGIVAVALNSDPDVRALVAVLDAQSSISVLQHDWFHYGGRPAIALTLRYQARGANANDVPRRLDTALRRGDVKATVLHTAGFSVEPDCVAQAAVEPLADQAPATEDHQTPPGQPAYADWARARVVEGWRNKWDLHVPLVGQRSNAWTMRWSRTSLAGAGSLPYNQHVNLRGDEVVVQYYKGGETAEIVRDRVEAMVARANDDADAASRP